VRDCPSASSSSEQRFEPADRTIGAFSRVARTFAHLLVPDLDDGRVVLSVMYQPERERLDALLRRVQVHQPFDQGVLREPRHRASVAVNGFVSEAFGRGLNYGQVRVSYYTSSYYTNAHVYK